MAIIWVILRKPCCSFVHAPKLSCHSHATPEHVRLEILKRVQLIGVKYVLSSYPQIEASYKSSDLRIISPTYKTRFNVYCLLFCLIFEVTTTSLTSRYLSWSRFQQRKVLKIALLSKEHLLSSQKWFELLQKHDRCSADRDTHLASTIGAFFSRYSTS